MNVITKRLADLSKMEKNVRRHNEKQIGEYIRSLEMFGQIRPIVIDEHNLIIAGNGMYDALMRMGRDTAECFVATGLTEVQKLKLMLADNRVYELGMTDMGIFDDIIKELDGDIDVPGWDEDLLRTLQASADEVDEMIGSYGVYTPEEVARVSERPREDHMPGLPVSAHVETLQRPYAPVQSIEQVSDKQQSQMETAPTATLPDNYIVCPHCGRKIALPIETGGA